MKFIYERFDHEYLERRVREEEELSRRRVEKIVLTPAEWRQFATDSRFDASEMYRVVLMAVPHPTWSTDGRATIPYRKIIVEKEV